MTFNKTSPSVLSQRRKVGEGVEGSLHEARFLPQEVSYAAYRDRIDHKDLGIIFGLTALLK